MSAVILLKSLLTAIWRFFYQSWKADNAEVEIVGTPRQLGEGKLWVVKARYTSPTETLTREIDYNVVQAAPIIQRPIERITFVKGREHKYDIVIHNFPDNTNIRTLLLGLGQETIPAELHGTTILEHTKQRIIGTIPADAEFTVPGGTLTCESSNTGGTDIVENIPYNIFDAEPELLFNVAVNPSSFTMSWVATDGALEHEYKFWKSEDEEPEGGWVLTEKGDSNVVFDEIDIGIYYSFKMRVASAWVGTPTETVTLATTAPELKSILATFIDTTTVLLRWTPVRGATHYQWRINGGAWNETTDTSATTTVTAGEAEYLFEVQVIRPFISDIVGYTLRAAAMSIELTKINGREHYAFSSQAELPAEATHYQVRLQGGEWREYPASTDILTWGNAEATNGNHINAEIDPGGMYTVEYRVSQPFITAVSSVSVTMDAEPDYTPTIRRVDASNIELSIATPPSGATHYQWRRGTSGEWTETHTLPIAIASSGTQEIQLRVSQPWEGSVKTLSIVAPSIAAYL